MTHIRQRRGTAAVWASENPVLMLGEVGWETDTRKAKLGDGSTAWNSLAYVNPTAPVTSVAGKTGAVSLVKADVGLSNVQNTSDAAKPVSVAQQAALDLKADLASPTFTGDPKAPTPAVTDDDTSIATTEWVRDYLANAPTAATPPTADNDTSIATTAFVKAAIAAMVRPSGFVRASTTQTMTNGTSTDVTFATLSEAVLKGGMTASASGLIIPAGGGGLYQIGVTGALDNSGTTGIMHVSVTVNGSTARTLSRGAFSSSSPTVKNGSDFLELAAGDVLGLRIFHTNSTDRPLWDPTSTFKTSIRAVLVSA